MKTNCLNKVAYTLFRDNNDKSRLVGWGEVLSQTQTQKNMVRSIIAELKWHGPLGMYLPCS
jgi:hypothetical protein